MTIEEPQLDNAFHHPIGQFNRNPSLLWDMRNAIYDPSYEMGGLPLDPHLRLFILQNCNHGNGDRLGFCTLILPAFRISDDMVDRVRDIAAWDEEGAVVRNG
ncbi:hypothetical protein VNO78_15209 [Psophocarpus tetragonolobus]|uniref:Uncharacterized protein n=1 Tax=Psophocarpus tetragonolobus TaxID=3891 RepID=A0AAN9SDR6_PSOTE